MQDVPEFLLDNVEGRSQDQKRLLLELQLLALWRETQGKKQFDRTKAVELRNNLAKQLSSKLKKDAEKIERFQRHARVALLANCQSVAEFLLGVEIYSEKPEELSTPVGKIGFNEKIQDKRTGVTYGTPRELLLEDGINWTDCGNPSEDLKSFIEKLKERYDDFSRPYSFKRPHERRKNRYCRFTLKLKIRPFSDAELSKKFPKYLKISGNGD